MNVVFGLLLIAFAAVFLLFNRRFVEISFRTQEAMGGPVRGRSARILRGYIRVLSVAIPIVMLLLGIGVSIGLLN